jgi:cytochrome c-type biogenesis protein CcmH
MVRAFAAAPVDLRKRCNPRMRLRRALMAAFFLMLAPSVLIAPRPALAVEASEMLADPALEARARLLSGEFRCLVCQNESIDESGAQLAHDLRVLIREQVSAGRSDAQIRDFLVARYGQFVLLRPRFGGETLLLWLGPFLILIIGAAVIGFAARRRSTGADAPLSADERARLENLHAE